MSNENKNIYSNWLHFKNTLPDEYFIDKIEKNRKIRPEVCLVILREVLDPVLVRNSDPERAELFIATGSSGKEIVRARINGEKFTSVERLTGLNLCRILNNINNEDWSIIAPSYSYNEPLGGLAIAINPDTMAYGAAGTEKGNTFSIKSRVIEGYTYTLEPYNLLNKEQHNALYETGTMMKVGQEGSENEDEQGRGLYTHVNIEPSTKMIHFVRIEAPTKEIFIYVLSNILNSTSYFARSTRKGNIRNKLLGLLFSKTAVGLSSGELIKEYFNDNTKTTYTEEEIVQNVQKYVSLHNNVFWEEYWVSKINNSEQNKIHQINLDAITHIALIKDEEAKTIIKEALEELTTQAKEALVKEDTKKSKGEATAKEPKKSKSKMKQLDLEDNKEGE